MFKRALLLRNGHQLHVLLALSIFNNGSVTATFSILCFDTPDDGLIRS
jgi:hypothetical protein